jgi:predicted RNA-binding protein
MCEANAYLVNGDDSRLVMEAVDVVEPGEDGLRLVNIFGEQKFLHATIHSLSLVDHKIYLKTAG